MDGQSLFSTLNPNIIEMSSQKEVSNSTVTKEKAEDSMSAKSVGRKNLKKTVKEKKLKNVNEQKRGDAYPEGESNNLEQNKNLSYENRKRKATTVEQSENNIEQYAEDNTSDEATNTTKSGESENVSGKIPKVKSARREKAEKVTEQILGDDSNNEKKKAGDIKENKKASSTNLPGKVHPPISEMVLDSFRALRKRNGTSTEEIIKYVEDNFQVNINRIKPHIKKFLQKGVADGLFDQVSGSGGDGKFKINKTGKVTKESQKLKGVKANEKRSKVKKAAPKNKKESVKVSRKFKNDKVRPKKRMGA